MKQKKLLLSLIICFAAAMIGGRVTGPALSTWYETVRKPGFTPPGAVFAPVWSLLYLLMALALYLVWRKRDEGVRDNLALLYFGVQLALNVTWSVVFFGFHSIAGGLLVIVALWLALVLTINRFWHISKAAAACLAPYLAWLTFAAVLNYEIWRLNS